MSRETFALGDLQLKTDSEGNRFIEFNIERQIKTRTGENPRNNREKKPTMYGDKSNVDRLGLILIGLILILMIIIIE